jgi:hypothetical protein
MMLFSIQRLLEDSFEAKHLVDVDQYAVRLANVYAQKRASSSDDELRKAVGRVRTAFYRRNPLPDRKAFERALLSRLDAKFKKESVSHSGFEFPGGVSRERVRLQRKPRRSLRDILEEFKHATESRGVDTIWESRTAGRLRRRPEKVAQGMLSQFVMGVLSNRGGELLRELASGTGFVDIVVRLSTVPHLVELKILRDKLEGPAQLEAYMKSERKSVGWLVVFDARKPDRKTAVPLTMRTKAGIVNIICVDVNPLAPSRRK